MSLRTYLIFLSVTLALQTTFSQMVVGPDTLVGNEWIRYGQSYYKFTLSSDGVYRIGYDALLQAGIPADALNGAEFRLFNMGRQVPLHTSTNAQFGSGDYIEFYGQRNRSDLDRFLYLNADQDLLNPDYSLYTDVNPYYLTLTGEDIPVRVNQIPNDTGNPPPPQEYYLHREYVNFHSDPLDPYFPLSEGGAISYSSYMHAEGFAKASEVSSTTLIPSLNRYLSGPQATLNIRFATSNSGPHSYIVSFNDAQLDTIELTNQQISTTTYAIDLTLLRDANELKLIAENAISRHAVVAIELIYPHLPVLSGATSETLLVDGMAGEQYHQLDGFPHNFVAPVIYTSDGLNRMTGNIDNNFIVFRWPETLTDIALSITDAGAGIQYINTLEERVFSDFSDDDTEYIVITHPDLMEPGTGSHYIQYRSSPEGGGYKAKAYSILDLYDQFGYGVEKHPQAIRNFVEFFDREWPSANMIFIVGRAIEYIRSRTPGAWEGSFFVPTFGRPGSDNLLAATLWDLVPRYPIGRLAVVDAQTVTTYLEKVKQHDAARLTGQTLEDKAWIKNVMHLGGGKTASEQNEFKSTLNLLGNALAHSDYGANIHFFQKTSTDQVGESQNAQILRLLMDGCGIINYLGHSASSTFEFNINDPAEWNNHERYPVFSAMGCSAGQIHSTIFSLSDSYVQIPNEGSIAFISGSGSQFAGALVRWASPWYEYIGETHYGGTLGASVLYGLAELKDYINVDLNHSNQYRFLLEQQTLQGDPALRFHPFPGSDYVVDRSSVSIEPDILDTKLDSFELKFSIVNIGRNLREEVPYTISIRRSDGQEVLIRQDTVSSLTYGSTVITTLPLETDGKPGSFRLLIKVDPDNHIEELPAPDAESNNNLTDNLGIEGIEFLVVDNVISAVYPPDFGIVSRTIPELIATGSNSFIKRQDLVMEIDTTALFNSPALVREKFIDQSPTLKWSPPMSFNPGIVYYWRVSTDSISPEQSYHWSTRSFIYLPGSSDGWNQSHFHQLTDNQLIQLLPDSTRGTFNFGSKSRNFNILNRFHDPAMGIIPRVVEDGIIKAEFFTGFRDRNVQAFVVVIDSLTGEYWRNPNPGLYGSANHLSFPAKVFPYRMDLAESRQALINLVEEIVKPGDYVFFYTYQRPQYPDYFPEQWASDEAIYGKSIFTMIENQFPSSAIRTLETTGSKPYIVFFQKDRGGIIELIAEDSTGVISYSYDIQLSFTEGTQISSLVGPAQRWFSIQHEFKLPAVDTAGRNTFSAWLLSADLTDTVLISNNIISLDTSIADVDAKAYPYMKLAFHTEDSVAYDPPDINYWRVLYDGYPELIINPDIGYVYIADSLKQGETMRLSTHIENVSDYEVDSLPVALRIISEDNTTQELSYIIPHLDPHSSAPVDFQKVTGEMNGNYQVLMEVNPGRVVNENNFINNIGILPLHVEGDRLNPVLDVTFDGKHILDGDLVSAKPLIAIQLHDENEYLRLDDTSSFALFLEFPSDFEPRQIYFADETVNFISSPGSGKNIATVELRPELYEDGIYSLQIRARDASGNFAGDNDFLISFEVINAESVSHLYNYPNPFSTATRFVYTLTGAAPPPYYKIQVMSVAGRIVREIDQFELGPLHIGTHMTEYIWDGTDESGDRLAAGTYLYRMIVKNSDMEDFDRYETSGDQTYFKKGWGKLVILR